jgi:RNase H-fold protein (predicted Holliday junction resolvase)
LKRQRKIGREIDYYYKVFIETKEERLTIKRAVETRETRGREARDRETTDRATTDREIDYY